MAEAGAIAGGGGARPGAVAVWIQAIRAPSLSAAAIPVLLGVAVAARAGFFSAGRMALALVGAMAIQAGTNLVNDYYDFRSGADSEQSLGPSMVIQRGLLSADQVWRGGIAAFALGALMGLVLVYQCGWPILAIGIPSVAAGYFYTASPVSLAYVALGELTVFMFMGPAIVMGAYFVMAMHFSSSALWASIPLGFLVAGILHANNIRDIESDTRHGKRTLATMLGRTGANYELIALDVAAYVATIVAIISHAIPWIALVVLVTIPRALDQIRIMTRENEPKKLNLGLFRSIQLHMEFGLLMIAAFLVAAFAGW
ncbi:MAG TPA: 1,4-dihydroxy-2-naphthoate octaprenyltransferase [Candidatus Binatus sp.]|uniref:1,4-dihydroxy-2-naphthoate octaprenyltransferase n=1 Tax=Candidatus Binatus sp. TaxID=2811406 RepID=UPI002B463FDA|nr:1,4-dihydroxy-2-naphthoate octaprenyltransferase [Candidatus Binatus sp.]HKN14131.1 1,4-dihydroxy-2-naphthoate octaprenyltransferase [Candidatus Binatus sp.]